MISIQQEDCSANCPKNTIFILHANLGLFPIKFKQSVIHSLVPQIQMKTEHTVPSLVCFDCCTQAYVIQERTMKYLTKLQNPKTVRTSALNSFIFRSCILEPWTSGTLTASPLSLFASFNFAIWNWYSHHKHNQKGSHLIQFYCSFSSQTGRVRLLMIVKYCTISNVKYFTSTKNRRRSRILKSIEFTFKNEKLTWERFSPQTPGLARHSYTNWVSGQ